MSNTMTFGQLLDAVDALTLDEQKTLVDIVEHRLAERSRRQLAADIEEARKEFSQSHCQAVTAETLMEGILSRQCGLIKTGVKPL